MVEPKVNALLTILHANPNRLLTIAWSIEGAQQAVTKLHPMKYSLLFAAVAISALPLTGISQDAPVPPVPPAADGGGAPPPPDGGPGGRRGGGGGPEQFRQRMTERLKTSLKASDEEMAVIQPLVEKVFVKQREASGGPGGPGGRRGGGNRPGGDAPAPGGEQRPGRGGETPESQALRETLEKDGAAPSEITAKLTALREQRKKAAAELTAAREDLRKVLTVRQEAVLVQMGLLE